MEDNSDFIGNYVPIREIGRGSFGRVLLVRHRFLTSRIAAMKVLHTSRIHITTERERFLREVRFLEKLSHPHILAILDAGIDEDIPYIVTRYAPNGSLRDLLNRYGGRPLAPELTLTIIKQIGQALYYAHEQGIIHHDVKPENILFDAVGRALLADFGISMMQESVQRQRSTASVGTPTYMAPERFQGYVSRRSDQYSLACVLYEMLTGRPPFIASNAIALGVKHARAYPIPPTRFNPDIPSHVEQAVLKALEKRRINRFDDVQSFILALQETPQRSQARTVNQSTSSRTQLLGPTSRTFEQYIFEAIELRNLGLYHDALFANEQAIRLDPSNATAFISKGNSLYCLKRYREALQAYEHACTLDPHNAKAHFNKGVVLYHFGNYKKALAAFDRAIQLAPYEANYHYNRGMALQYLGHTREAQRAFAKAKQLRGR